MNNITSPLLGSAMWGEWISESEVYELLDKFYESDFRGIDIATNYPINERKHCFKKALCWLHHWCQVNKIQDLEIYLKVGSISNQYTNNIDLSPSYLSQEINEYLELFSSNLSTIGIHWDNRGASLDDIQMISETLHTMKDFQKSHNLNIGFSGIENLKTYKSILSQLNIDPLFQIKENLLTSESREKYMGYFEAAKYIAYGINFGSSKRQLSEEGFLSFTKNQISEKAIFANKVLNELIDIQSISELCILYSDFNPYLSNYIVAPSAIHQLESSIKFIKVLGGLNLSSAQKEMIYGTVNKLFHG